MPAGQDPDNVIGLVPFNTNCTVVKIGLCFLVTLLDSPDLEFADGFLCCIPQSALVPIPGICISKPLDVIKDEPCEGNDHQDNEGDGDKHNRRAAHIFLQVPGSDGDVHGHGDVSFQQAYNLLPFWLRNHYGHDVFYTRVGHGDGLVGVGAHVEDDHRGGVLQERVPDLIPVRAVALGDEGYPVLAVGRGGKLGVGVAGQAVVGRAGHDHLPAGVLLRRVLSVAPALCLLRVQLRAAAARRPGPGVRRGLRVGDVHEGGVPFLLLGHCKVQAEQMHETKGKQPC